MIYHDGIWTIWRAKNGNLFLAIMKNMKEMKDISIFGLEMILGKIN